MSEEFEIGSMWRRIDKGDWATKTGEVRVLTAVDADSVTWDDGTCSWKVALAPDRKVWRRLPSSQPEKPAVCGHTWEGGRVPCVGPKGHKGMCSNVDGMNWELGPTAPVDEESERCGPYSGDDLGHEQYIAQQMAVRDSEFHEKQKAAILANYEAQRKEPAYQPHWQRTGAVSTYSRRVPR